MLAGLAGTLFFSQGLAQATPSDTNLSGQAFPRINADLSVTVRLKAPEAGTVMLEGGDGLVARPLALTKNSDGLWEVTTPPAAPGFHYHWFTVDGLRVNDPGTKTYFGWGRDTSGVEVPDKDGEFYSARAEVPRGTVRIEWYPSKITGKERRCFVYTPPGYETDPGRYPVLYLLHGSGESERSWGEQGRANFIMDNLLAARKARPFLIVMDSGYAAFPEAPPQDRSSLTAAFRDVLTRELIPYIDGRYRTRADAAHRAMAGLSMGGGQTLNIAPQHPELFAYIASMSTGGRGAFDPATSYGGAFKDAASFAKGNRLLFLSAGTTEPGFHTSVKAMHDSLTAAGIPSIFFSSEGTSHEWQTWRRSLHDLAPRLFQPD
jgi:enterochelin esterase-like enzyme